jgi:3-oxoacyl-[acyl-carrier protein] reductase
MISYTGQSALITGGTRGIGLAIADRLLSLGARVTITGRAAKAPAGLDRFSYMAVDFSDSDSTGDFCEELESMPEFDVLVNNAGINFIHRIEDYPEKEFMEIAKVNYTAVYLVSQSVARVMMKAGSKGRIVNIGSIWATNTRVGRSAYCAAKAGVLGMTRAISVDLASAGIMVNTVSPGFVMTELTQKTMGPEVISEVSASIPVGRLAHPNEIAEVVAFIASSNNTYLTGQNVIVDGGFTNV